LELSDLGNAWRLVAAISNILYNHNSGKWLNWDGRRWNERTGTSYVLRQANRTAKNITKEANTHEDFAAKKALLRWALTSQRKNSIDNMLSMARHLKRYETYSPDYDRDPWLFNCLNGTLDLRTGKLRWEHRQEDMITKLCPVEYDEFINEPDNPNRCEKWYEFLDTITNRDKSFQRFLQQVAGYSLTGDTSEERVLFIYGRDATGKSTFIEALKSTMGDYVMTADFETFLKQHQVGAPRPDIARLAGARAVMSIETDKGKQLAEGLIKILSGGDTITARQLYKDLFEFKPQFKIWLAANDAPKVSDTDTAMWRRLLRVPFSHHIPKREQDPKMKKILSNPKIAGATILFWAVEGCLDWQKNGLKIPKAVQQSTKEYREEMNPLKTFFEEHCEFSEGRWTPRQGLYDSYLDYCRTNGIRFPLRQSDFNERLEERNCVQTRKSVLGKQIKVWIGVKIQK
jgi:putative DNA primase/helicase